MTRPSAKPSTSEGRKKVQVKDLSKSEQKLSARQMKNVAGGKASTSDIAITKQIDKPGSK